jgi:SynChlorMet cassette protein ScmD
VRDTPVEDNEKPIVNPRIVLREEFDDWAVLFNPDAGLGFAGFGLNPTGVYVWKLLDGEHTLDAVLQEICRHAESVPEDACDHIDGFVATLLTEGLVGCGDKVSYAEKCSHRPPAGLAEVKLFTYETPRLVNLSSGQEALGACVSHGSQGGNCYTGAGATGCCISGGCGTNNGTCCSGTCGSPDGCGCGSCYGYCDTGSGGGHWCYGGWPQCVIGCDVQMVACAAGN